jgi:peptide/nickel transport system permease protein
MKAPLRLAGVCVVLVAVFALAGPWLPLSSPTEQVGPPFAGPSVAHLLGTDLLGRDALARLAHGGRTPLLQALGATILGSLVGLGLGTLTGLARGGGARVALRIIDATSALPPLLLLLLLAAGRPGDDLMVLVAITAVSVPFSVRVIREATRRVAATAYVTIARARGDSRWRLIRHDIMPNIAETALAEAGIRFVAATQLTATAGFLGLGASAPAANWGRMVRENAVGITLNPWPLIAPAALIVVLALGFTLVIDRLAARSGAELSEAVTA